MARRPLAACLRRTVALVSRRFCRPAGSCPSARKPSSVRHHTEVVPTYTVGHGTRSIDELRDALVRLQPDDAVMCAETLWWKCHRRLIADALTVRGVEVVHLLGVDETQPHKTPAFMRVSDDGWPVYDVGVTRPLL